MKKTIALAVIAAVSFAASSCTRDENAPAQKHHAAAASENSIADKQIIDSALQEMVDDGAVVGVSALVYKDGEEAYFGAFGMADDAKGRDMNRETIALIYSMTKPIAGVALMTLYEEGAFKLDDPITKYAPEFASLKVYAGEDENGEPILRDPSRIPTVLDFMRHTAGLMAGHAADENPALDALYREVNPTDINGTLEEMPAKLASVPLLSNPGERWLYSAAVDVQALLVERLSGKPFDDYLQEVIFDPLRMDETGYYVEEANRDRLAGVYNADEVGKLSRIADEDAYAFNTQRWPYTPGSFGLTSTLDDYMRFARMLLNEGELDGARILQPETVRLMATNYLSDDVTERSWLPSKGQVGFGIDFAVRVAPPASDDENYGYVGEFFWDGAASTLFWVDPENDLASVFFIQRMPFYNRAHKVFRDAVYGVPERG